MTSLDDLSADDVKLCCATAYQNDVVALVLGESYHPGGLDLTRRLARALDLRAGERVLDIASGPGTTAFLLAAEFGVDVEGIDLGPVTVDKANATSSARGLGEQVRFRIGDAERLPVPDASFDAVVCECAFCTFPDKPTAAAEIARVLKPGGRVGITDVALDPDRLDAELKTLAGWVACIADARPMAEYVALLENAGLEVTRTEPHDDAVTRMIEQIDGRLAAYSMLKHAALENVDVPKARERCTLAARAVEDGIAGYSLIVARKR